VLLCRVASRLVQFFVCFRVDYFLEFIRNCVESGEKIGLFPREGVMDEVDSLFTFAGFNDVRFHLRWGTWSST